MGQTRNLDTPIPLAQYQLTAHLAEGRMGDVFKAKSHGVEGFEKILCVKVIDPEFADEPGFVDTLIEEAKRAVSLSHANVAQVYDLGRDEESDNFYIATEYINGFDLRRALGVARRADRDWPRDLSIYIASETAKGIDYAHNRKDFNFNNLDLVHRDVAPPNIMISFDGEVKITDFGISRAMDTVSPRRERDPGRRFKYAAPEHARGEAYTRQSDIFSIGLMLYEMLAGFHPYERDDGSLDEVAATGDIPPLASVVDIPQQLQRIVDSTLVPDPTGRAESAGMVYEELVGYLFGNNLRADNRALSLLMEELRQAEKEISTEMEADEAGLEQISHADVQDFYDRSSASLSPPVDRIREMRDAQYEAEEDPTVELRPDVLADEPSGPLPDLPGGLEECFESALDGEGKAVLMSGHFGRGPEYLPDRLSEVLGWREETPVLTIHATPDDVYRPFRVVGDLVVPCLVDEFGDARHSKRAALDQLRRLEVPDEAVDLLAGIWGFGAIPDISYEQRCNALADLVVTALEYYVTDDPVVLVVDHIERADGLSVDVLREVIGQIDRLPVMLVLATSADELMREAFDVGRPESLKAVRVSAPDSPDLAGIPDLSEDASRVLLALAISEQPLSYPALATIFDIEIKRIADAAEELTAHSLVRTPSSNTLITGVAEASVWVKQRFARQAVERTARALTRHYSSRGGREDPGPESPTLVRLYAMTCERRRMLSVADEYSDWLQRNGWLDVALDFYEYIGDLLAQEAIGTPQARIAYLVSRAELALQLSRLDQARSSLEPLRALSESVRNEQGFVRSQLLFGRMAMQQDDLDKAHESFHRATSIARGLREPQLLAQSLLSLTAWAERFGNVRLAQERLEGAMNLSSRWGTYRMDLDSRSIMLRLAVRVFAERGMARRAERHQESLDQLADSSGLGQVECRAAMGRAELLAEAGDYQQALGEVGRSQQTARRTGLTVLTIALLRRRAALALEAGRQQLVVSVADELVEVARQHEDLYSAQRGRDLRATARASLGQDRESAIKHLRASLRRALDRDVPRDIYRCHKNLARALGDSDPTEAAEHRRKAREANVRQTERTSYVVRRASN